MYLMCIKNKNVNVKPNLKKKAHNLNKNSKNNFQV